MRTIIDLPENDIKMLDHLAKGMKASRAELVRRSVSAYLEKEIGENSISSDIYGLYDDVFTQDSVGLQQELRSDWDEREASSNHWSLQEPKQQPYITKNHDNGKKC